MALHVMVGAPICRVLTAAFWNREALAMATILRHGSPDSDFRSLCGNSVCAMQTCQRQLGHGYHFQMLEFTSNHHPRMGRRW